MAQTEQIPVPLGRFETALLGAVKQLGEDNPDNAYGKQLTKVLSDKMKRPVKIAQLYRSISKLKDTHLIAAYDVESKSTHGPRKQWAYILTPKGAKALTHAAKLVNF